MSPILGESLHGALDIAFGDTNREGGLWLSEASLFQVRVGEVLRSVR